MAALRPLCDRLRFRGGALHARRHLAGDGALFLDRGCGGRDILADALIACLMLSGADDVAGEAVEISDLLPDLVGRLLGLGGEVLDLGRHHGKAAPGLAGPR